MDKNQYNIFTIIFAIMALSFKVGAQGFNPFGSYEVNDSVSLLLNIDESFELYRSDINLEKDELYGHQPLIEYSTIKNGIFCIEDTFIFLESKSNCSKCQQKLLMLDNDRIVILEGNCLEQINDTIYLTRKNSLKSKSIPEYSGKWKNGKKTGWWTFFRVIEDSLIIEKVLFDNGMPVDTVRTREY